MLYLRGSGFAISVGLVTLSKFPLVIRRLIISSTDTVNSGVMIGAGFVALQIRYEFNYRMAYELIR